ncbi:type II secretion system minor pseudopilin GspK [Thalassomonas sp. M1454]|uniref:type II secretion system minor pseudopilin GspK n=1 Tax=Thalassomonas sp. M1454 TaxID=2594477 RepID=UPI00117E9E75|nr:type II secretion system minor pseudopilin GspK [Thalassomonas sp. M1454]TRX57894.1 general secretion pathway protein GspK [Thalassomonas sp. M1454]
MIRLKQTGVALITVMLIMAIAVVLATKMNSALIFQIERTANINSNQQAYWYAMGAEAFAKTVLNLSFKDEQDVTNLSQIWASGETSFPVDLGSISGEISDMQSCFNLNSLKNTSEISATDKENDENESAPPSGPSENPPGSETPKPPARNSDGSKAKTKGQLAKDSFKELVIALNVEGISSFEAESMAESLYDWLDSDSAIISAGGAEDNDYAAKKYPYLAANSLLASVNELRLIEHFTPQVIYALKDHVCVIPNSNLHAVNINTLDSENPELLQALLGGLDKSKVEEIFSERGEEGFEKISDFTATQAVKDIQDFNLYKQQFVVDSDYFKLKTKTEFNDSYFSMNSIMKVNKNQTITVVERSIGAD